MFRTDMDGFYSEYIILKSTRRLLQLSMVYLVSMITYLTFKCVSSL